MKYTFLIIALLSVFLFLGCPPEEETYRVYYNANGATGSVPVDSREYTQGSVAIVLGKGNLTNGDYSFLGWRYNNKLYSEGEKITVNWTNINLYAAWDDVVNTTFQYKIENGEVTIFLYNEYSYTITIPETLQSKPVTAIDDGVFSGSNISRINLSKNLKKIGVACFASNRITQLVIPDNVVSIGIGAFQDNKLNRITFGKGITDIEAYTFNKNELTAVYIPDNIKSIGIGAFNQNNIGIIKIGADVDIKSDTSFGTYGASFKTYYDDHGKTAGTYIYTDDDWVLP